MPVRLRPPGSRTREGPPRGGPSGSSSFNRPSIRDRTSFTASLIDGGQIALAFRPMKIAVVGAGAMGSVYAGLLGDGGNEVWAVDVWCEHVEAIRSRGL